MATPIFNVDVNDEAFKRFKAHFDGYNRAVEKLPAAWRRVNKATQEGLKINEKMVETIDRAGARMGGLARGARSFSGDLLRAERAMLGMTMSTGKIATNMASTAYSFAKMAGLMTLGAGLAGAGSLWGIAGLANSAANMRRTTQGLNLAPGELRAYQTNYSRFADPSAVLSNVAGAKNDPSSQWAFSAMGVPDWQSRSTADLATTLPLLAKRIFAEGGQNTQYAEARGLTQFFSVEDLRRLHEMTEAEIIAAGRRYEVDRRQMQVSDDVAKRWQNFSVQLDRSAAAIESTFIKALGPLAPELEKLSDAFTDAVKNVMATDKVREVVEAMASGIRTAGDYMASGRFASDIKDFGTGLREMWEGMRRVARWISGFAGAPQDTAPGRPYMTQDFDSDEERQRRWRRWSVGRPEIDGSTPGVAMRALENDRGLPHGVLQRLWGVESGFGRNLGPSSAGAQGHFQFMPQTGAQYGLSRPEDFNDFNKSAVAASRYLSDLRTQYRGDLTAALAAYNFGPRKVNELMDKYGANWEQGLPPETRAFLEKFRTDNSLGPRIDIRVDNRTGGQITVQQTGTVAQ